MSDQETTETIKDSINPDRYIPGGSTPIRCPGTTAVVYVRELPDGRCSAMGYRGKGAKHAFHYSFKTKERMDQYIGEMLKAWAVRDQAKVERVAKEKSERAAFSHTLKVGDVLSYSWGYDQTNIDFYEVTKVVSGKTVRVREIGSSTKETGFMCGDTMPAPGVYVGEEMIKKVREGNRVSMAHGSAHPWDGKPERCSWYA